MKQKRTFYFLLFIFIEFAGYHPTILMVGFLARRRTVRM